MVGWLAFSEALTSSHPVSSRVAVEVVGVDAGPSLLCAFSCGEQHIASRVATWFGVLRWLVVFWGLAEALDGFGDAVEDAVAAKDFEHGE